MKKFSFLSLLALTACFDSTSNDDLAPPGSGSSDDGGGESGSTGKSEGSDDDDGGGSGDGSGGDESSGDETGGSDSTADTDDSGDSTSSSGDDLTDSESGSSLGTNTTSGQMGEEKFPGDWCDPFIDWCADVGSDYECIKDAHMLPNYEYETIFTCKLFNDIQGDGTYEDPCNLYNYEQCRTGFLCTSTASNPDMNCATSACCTYLCKYQEICSDGQECEPMVWQADLADYLDPYVAIGYCPS